MGISDVIDRVKRSFLSEKNRKSVRAEPAPNRPILVDIMGNDLFDTVHAKDISAGGIGVRIDKDFRDWRLKTEVDMRITLPDETAFKAKGVIRFKGENRLVGIIFSEISDENKERIDRYVLERQNIVSKIGDHLDR